jgi:hypothetical protein
MSREKQIEEMDEDIGEAIMHNSVVDIINGGFIGVNSEGMARELYDDGYRKQEWISVEDRLPEDTIPTDYKYKTIKVLVAIKEKNGITIRTQKRFLDYAYRDDERTAFWTWRFSAGNVTHWMPLPEPPKKGGAE